MWRFHNILIPMVKNSVDKLEEVSQENKLILVELLSICYICVVRPLNLKSCVYDQNMLFIITDMIAHHQRRQCTITFKCCTC